MNLPTQSLQHLPSNIVRSSAWLCTLRLHMPRKAHSQAAVLYQCLAVPEDGYIAAFQMLHVPLLIEGYVFLNVLSRAPSSGIYL